MTDTFAVALMVDARSHVSRTFHGIDTSDMPADAVKAAIDATFPGGWSAYQADFRRFYANARRAAVPEWTESKVRVFVEYQMRVRFTEYDIVHSFDFGDTSAKVVYSRATVDRKSRRDIVTARTLHLVTFQRHDRDSLWTLDAHVEYTEDTHEEYVRYGSIMTPDRAAAMREQVETCYRPGTSKAPMAGWIARAQLSWEQAHADDMPEVSK